MGDGVDAALSSKLLKEDDVDVRPGCIPARITDNHVDIYRVKKKVTTPRCIGILFHIIFYHACVSF